ncbi:F-box protein [Frankliniella fusca]|uniref:F-box protein n=1 Tax=Frankliniella fusca TaxID=407009 RepID=A0AAE1HAB8_9NEOP|nr:F-box protein [Frankliniella fusca]
MTRSPPVSHGQICETGAQFMQSGSTEGKEEYDLGFRATTSSRIFPPISSQKPPNFFFLSREKNGLEGSKFDVSNKCPNLGIKSVS